MEQYFYPVLLQHSSEESNFDETVYFRDLLQILKERLTVKDTEWKKSISETIQKSGASLHGGLGQFLSTPLKSDKEEIDRLIRENIENILHQLGYGPYFNTIKCNVYKILEPQQVPLHRQLVGVMRRILKNGKSSLTDAGVTTGKNSGTIYCFAAQVEGISHLYSLKMEFEASLAAKQESSFNIVNESILAVQELVPADPSTDNNVVVMNFSSSKEVAERIRHRMHVMTDQFGVKETKLLMRSFSTGFTTPFQIQFTVDITNHALGSIIMSLVDEDAEIEDALTTQGSLIVLEKIV